MGTDHRGSFTTHASYLRAFATLCGYYPRSVGPASVRPSFAARVRSTVSASAQIGMVRLDDVRRSLVNAWGAELILALSGQYATEDELMRLVNNWGTVQGYYALYHATQALAQARGMARPESHPKTQNIFLDCWATPSRELAPLSLCVGADGLRCGARDIPMEDVHQWSLCTPENAFQIAGLALRTTRDEAVREALRRRRVEKLATKRRAWREGEQRRVSMGRVARQEPTFPLPQLVAMEKGDTAARVRRHGLLDYLYRLRIKTNYEDSRMFTEGPADAVSSKHVHADLRHVVETVLLATEIHVQARVGRAAFGDWVRDWVESKTPRDVGLGLAERASLLLESEQASVPRRPGSRPEG
jgi:hypothetical protein